MAVTQNGKTPWTNPEVEQGIREKRHSGKITEGEKPNDLERIDFLHFDSINTSLMSIGLELAYLEGHKPDPHNTEDFIRCLMRSTVPPAVVLQWVGMALGVAVPKEITAAVERLRDREAAPRVHHGWSRTYCDWAAEQSLIEQQSDPDWRELMEGFVAYARRQYWCGVHDSRNIFKSR